MFLTGTRADYGKIKSLIKKLDCDNNFEVYIYITGMHLNKKFGSTYKEIQKDGFKNIYLAKPVKEYSSMDISLADNIIQFSNYLKKIHPDLIFVHGDRLEALAGAIVGAFNNTYVAHIEGGEVSGTIDESIRHAISKMSHFHFVCNEKAKQRLIQMGENKDNIYIAGSPDIDIMLSSDLPSLENVKKYYDIDYDSYAILIYHPVTTELNSMEQNTNILINAVKKTNDNYIVIYPNNDIGNDIIMEAYKKLEDCKNFKIFPSLNFEKFLTLLKNAKYIIGNSSAGVMESGIYGTPAINIGSRQRGRYDENKVPNIQTIDYIENDILNAIDSVDNYKTVSNFFGNGNSCDVIVKELSKESFWNKDVQKFFYDLNIKNIR